MSLTDGGTIVVHAMFSPGEHCPNANICYVSTFYDAAGQKHA
jgi:hypothetical protein